jgi:hypothetical protein
MPPDWVVVRFDIFEDIGLGFLPCLLAAAVDLLNFQRVEKVLQGGVVVAAALFGSLHRKPRVSNASW